MNHRIRVNVVTRKKGLFGMREVVTKKTVTVSGKEYRRMRKAKWNRPSSSEAERLAALCMVWEEELADERGED